MRSSVARLAGEFNGMSMPRVPTDMRCSKRRSPAGRPRRGFTFRRCVHDHQRSLCRVQDGAIEIVHILHGARYCESMMFPKT